MSIEPYRGGVEITVIAPVGVYPQDFKLLATATPKTRKALAIKTSADYRSGNTLVTHLGIPERVATYYVMVMYRDLPVGMAAVCKDTKKWIER